MAHFKVNQKHIFFILKEQLNYGSLCALDRCKDLDEKTLDLLVSEAMNFGNSNQCRGYLFGKENKGLAHMFQMMNAARINTGVSAMSLAGTAYRNALDYTRQRVQGKDIGRM